MDVRPEKVAAGAALAAALRAGEDPGTLPDAGLESLLEALRHAEYVPEHMIDAATEHGTRRGQRRPLTKLMQRTLQLYADGLEPKEIAAELGASVSSVHNRNEAARFNLDARTVTQAVAIAVAAGLVTAKPLPHYATKGSKVVRNARRREAYRRSHKLASQGLPTPRETEMLQLAAAGLSNEEIAEALGVSLETVKTTLRHGRARLGAKTTAQAVAIAVRRGLID